MGNDDDYPAHAADEPTAMWGADALKELGLDRPPSEPPKGPATEASEGGSEGSVQLSMGAAEAPHQPVGKPGPGLRGSKLLPWILTFVGAVLLAVGAYLLVRLLRG